MHIANLRKPQLVLINPDMSPAYCSAGWLECERAYGVAVPMHMELQGAHRWVEDVRRLDLRDGSGDLGLRRERDLRVEARHMLNPQRTKSQNLQL